MRCLKNGLLEREWCKVENTTSVITFEVESKWLTEGEKRLNASSFSPEAANSLFLIDLLKEKGIKIDYITDIIKDIFYPPRFKRLYAKAGTIFLSSKDIFDFLPEGKKIKNASKEYLIKPGWILITRSGSVGRVLIANRFFTNAAISEHVIRIVPDENTPTWYLYVYLISEIGQPLLIRNIFGGVVDEIEPHHIANIPIPRIPELEDEINQKILEAHRLREEAQEFLLKAEEMIYSELGLSKIDEDDVEYFGGDNGRIIKSFEIKASDINLRLDASYHIPLFHLVIQNLMKARSRNLKRLEDVADSFVPPRFKRAYVRDPSDGIPLLQGTHIPQITPQDIKYIWNKMKNLNLYIVRKNWILVTCSGTIGRLSLVRDYWNGWTATNHLLRIIPNESEIHPGYLTAFLLSIYGQVQFQRLIYGGVVDEIGEAGELFDDILILKTKNKDIENKIGNFTFEAYDKRDKANQIENEAIEMLEKRLKEIAAG